MKKLDVYDGVFLGFVFVVLFLSFGGWVVLEGVVVVVSFLLVLVETFVFRVKMFRVYVYLGVRIVLFYLVYIFI